MEIIRLVDSFGRIAVLLFFVATYCFLAASATEDGPTHAARTRRAILTRTWRYLNPTGKDWPSSAPAKNRPPSKVFPPEMAELPVPVKLALLQRASAYYDKRTPNNKAFIGKYYMPASVQIPRSFYGICMTIVEGVAC